MTTRVAYLAGPMSGIAQFNFPAFDEAARRLREKGHVIISPAELDDPDVRTKAMDSADGAPSAELPSWGALLARDVSIVADLCNALILLPGWAKSRGAKLEAYVALLCGHSIYFYDGRFDFANLIPVPHAEVRAHL